ncbi:MAG TPA: hypothetical protein VKS44_17055, partial [Candidatus Acidoferrales bacterium]|nr:hypothetical protein [Candidatus Acidoferrales bacterium]
MRRALLAIGVILLITLAAHTRAAEDGRNAKSRSAAPQAPAQTTALPFTLKQVGPNAWAAIDLDGHSGSNAGFVIGDD